MPIGINYPVKRFVRGHLYKVYSSINPSPDRYTILRFKRKKIRNSILPKTLKILLYEFITLADNLSDRHFSYRYLDRTTISECKIEEVLINDLPRYLGAKYIAPEFENVLKGKPIYRRKKNKILPPNLHKT
jgi:hypothetical protein